MKMLGLIGLGAMGSRMAKNLIKAGYKLVVYDKKKEVLEEFAKLGAIPAESPKEVGEKVDIVLLSLPTPQAVEEVVLGESGILQSMKEGGVIIDLSTIDPQTTYKLAEEAQKKGVKFADAPVSGSVWGAEKATLTIMAGSDKETFQKIYKILSKIGKKIIHVGPTGSGQVTKLANNLCAAVNLLAVIEAFTWAVKQGVDPGKLYEVISSSSGDSWELRNRLPGILERKFEPPTFKLALMHKDVGLFIKTSNELKVFTPLATIAHQVLQAGMGIGLEEKDWASIAKLYEMIAGVELKKQTKQK